MKPVRSSTMHLLFAAATCVLVQLAAAQDSARPAIRLIVPFPVGSAPDVVARVVTTRLAEHLDQPIVIDNRVGAGGTLGATAAAQSAPDGLTLFFGTVGTHAINASLYKRLPYDPIKDFAPVAALTSSANVLIVRNDLGVHTLSEFVALAKRNSGRLTMGSPGNGTTPHLSGVMLNKAAGIDTLHVPFKASPMLEIVAGRIDYSLESVISAIPLVHTGKVTAIAVTSPTRVSQLKDVPTIAESGYPGYSVLAWVALFAPARTPAHIITRINEATNKALSEPALVAKLTELASEPLGGTPQALQERVKSEVIRWQTVVRESGASVD